MGLKVLKVSGAGNTFLIVDITCPEGSEWMDLFATVSRKKVAQKLCDSFFSIGADGFLVLESDTTTNVPTSVRWDFYNADGSRAKMCGNAARCVALYLNGARGGTRFSIHTGAGIVRAAVQENSQVDVEMPPIKAFKSNLMASKTLKYDFVDSGVPHAVVRVSTLRNVDKLVETVDLIRKQKLFTKTGTNVTFYVDIKRNSIESLTFERGVSGYTQACGTGAVAAAYAWSRKSDPYQIEALVNVQVPGGILKVKLTTPRPHLMGPAKIIAEISINRSDLI